MKLTDQQRAELKALADAATSGPWDTSVGLIRAIFGDYAAPIAELRSPYRHGVSIVKGEREQQANAAFIAAAREAIPALLADLEEAEAAIKSKDKALETERTWRRVSDNQSTQASVELSKVQRELAGAREVIADHNRLVRELDVLLCGEAGAAKQAALCDLVGYVQHQLGGMTLAEVVEKAKYGDSIKFDLDHTAELLQAAETELAATRKQLAASDAALIESRANDREAMQQLAEAQAREKEALDMLEAMFSKYEGGVSCFESPEDQAGFLGYAIHLPDDEFKRIAAALNDREAMKPGYFGRSALSAAIAEAVEPYKDDAEAMALLATGEWELMKMEPCECFTEEANRRSAWSVKRQRAPYREESGVGAWFGSTPLEAFQNAKVALGLDAALAAKESDRG